MAAKIPTDRMDNAIQLYLAGETVEKIRAATGVAFTTLSKERQARGIPPRSEHTLPIGEIVDAYLAGASENALAVQHGVSRGTIAKRLNGAGIERRGLSEAGVTRNQKLTPSERKSQVAAANRAARMRTVPQVTKLRNALHVEAAGQSDSAGEATLAAMLEERGLAPIKQRAIGVYNVDMAILPVAVEVLGGGWHAVKSVHAERTPYILDEGWHLLMVWDYEGRSALGPGAANYIVAFLDEIRRNPPATSQYRVISGSGELLAASGRESNEFPLVPPPRGALG